MKYYEHPSADANFFFALEYYLLTEKRPPEGAFLLWRTEPTLMLGNFQNIYSEIDPEYAAGAGVRLTRRRSGGGTIYTDMGGWQYSFVLPGQTPGTADFQKNSQVIVDALKALGVPAEFSGRNDILAGGRKISGTARYGSGAGIVHHGSLLYSTDLDRMEKCLRPSGDKLAAKGVASVRQRVANLSEYLGEELGSEGFAKKILDAAAGESRRPETLSRKELDRVADIQGEFSSWDRVWGKNPEFELTRSRRFTGGGVEIRLNSRRGRIEALRFHGDFFYDGEIAALESALRGARLEAGELSEIIAREAKNKFFGIGSEELAALIVGE